MGTTNSKNTNNPFAELNIRQFPRDRQHQEIPRRSDAKHRAPSLDNAMPADSDQEGRDADLFFQAVGTVHSLMGKSPARRPELSPTPSSGKADALSPLDTVAPLLPAKDAARGKKRLPGAQRERKASSTEVFHNGALAQELARRQGLRADASPAKSQTDPAEGLPEKPKAQPASRAVGLSDHEEERNAFRRAMVDVVPLSGKGRAVVLRPAPQPGPGFEPSNPLQELVDGKVEFSLSGTDEFMEGHVVGLDLLTVGKLQARHYSPEAHIDLHGLNSEQAFQHLVHFFRGAYYKGVRTALVVTGRGLNSPNGIPVLRFKVQQWLMQEPFRRVILAFCTAKREDGGPGALYVLLRKYRKNSGKVRWDAMPADPDLFL